MNDCTAPRIPKIRHHKTTGEARVRIKGKDIYLGRWGTPKANQAYRRAVAHYLETGEAPGPRRDPDELTVRELVERYTRHAERSMQGSTVASTVEPVTSRLLDYAGDLKANEFGPAELKAFRRSMLDERIRNGRRLSLEYVNGKLINRTRTIFRWGVGEELVEPDQLARLEAVRGLRPRETDAPRCEPVRPVDDSDIEATLPHLPDVVADMVRVQRCTGMRPGELCGMTWSEIDRTRSVWQYSPSAHKNSHRGKDRVIAIGPRAQQVLIRYLSRPLREPIFSPAESEHRRRGAMPARPLGSGYTTQSFGRAVRRACEQAGLEQHWSPNQLRHTRATEVRAQYGLDAAGATLGHAKLDTSQIYAERDWRLSERVAEETG